MTERKSSLPDTSAWEVTTMRLTAFPAAPAQSPELGMWAAVVGQEPEQQISKPKTNEIIEEGRYQIGVLNFTHQLTRLDWRIILQREVAQTCLCGWLCRRAACLT